MTISMPRTTLIAGAVVILGLAAIGLVQAAPIGADADAAAAAGTLDAILAADQTAAAPVATDGAIGRLPRLRLGKHVVHGTVILDLPNKGLVTVQLDHGTISAVNANELTVAEAGGTSVTVDLGDSTRVRKDGQRATRADLKKGDQVFVLSKVESSGAEAYLVLVPKA